MDPVALTSYLLVLLVLFAKFFTAIAIQARERFRARRFRYPEDAAYWRGSVAEDTELCVRAQNLLRNDGESQTYFLAFGLFYLLLGAAPVIACLYFGAYATSRLLHAYFFLTRRQPHRNRAFAAGVVVLTALAVHVAFATAVSLSRYSRERGLVHELRANPWSRAH
jgi:uncharacterized MAPEG superfamily protein